jgi:hypothetical protein
VAVYYVVCITKHPSHSDPHTRIQKIGTSDVAGGELKNSGSMVKTKRSGYANKVETRWNPGMTPQAALKPLAHD